MTTKTLPQRLRELRAAARPHFQPHDADGTPRPAAFSIVATEARLQDLLTAASELEAQQRAEDRKTVQRLQGWIELEEAAANAGQSEARVWQDRYMALLTEVASMRALLPPAPMVIEGAGLHLLTHDQVREAALAELATWDQAAPGGPTAYEVARSICRRLGVEL